MQYKYYIALAIVTPLALFAYIVALGYTPLSEALISLPDETVTLLFSVQAGIMAATLGHFIGTKKGLKSIRVTGKAIAGKQPIKMKYMYILLIGILLAIFIVPFVINAGDFSGTDGQGPDVIASSGYEPWFDPVGYVPDELGERILFSLQVGIGASILGYFVGYMRAKPD
ncbi:energy-coupling factor ABC transporter substrate-binding protein [Candidatus Bathycorpusculum sp.]|uniref:energy-coupling factor ABC transporter substrate-binding protein n=1 Tax=Candidatus Bathycorpusculum sp. TaxID=2994959 RepID=UPI0028365D8B|nr:energy-coupling factor ABC transporter substrate-binding protein [Candidatus Termitimicrobium sp.]MCL2430938.1 energy-coupling factor ABC transporter substrate-binding protein [Candidatus Termitimicrobium sp.]